MRWNKLNDFLFVMRTIRNSDYSDFIRTNSPVQNYVNFTKIRREAIEQSNDYTFRSFTKQRTKIK